MSSYLDARYKASRHEPYYESHTQGRIHNCLGYWSFEAAAISIVLDIDDAEFRDRPFYGGSRRLWTPAKLTVPTCNDPPDVDNHEAQPNRLGALVRVEGAFRQVRT
ncbi:PoNe immunity protein domain-containing protein [Cupriavidus sp. MP-37]|uniref:PoNe immunity protein domain-containing protein n=1 Tax=Cupriavidus sp. MP-37 TaxID=2884455 RepID=UPI00351CFA69